MWGELASRKKSLTHHPQVLKAGHPGVSLLFVCVFICLVVGIHVICLGCGYGWLTLLS